MTKERIIVTGCNGQLGSTLVSSLIRDGFGVIGVDLKHSLQATQDIERFELDISDESAVRNFFDQLSNPEEICGLVNNAGVAVFSRFADRTYDEIKRVTDVNIAGTVMMTQHFMRVLEPLQTKIRVVNIGSIYGCVAPDLSIYGDTPRMSSEIYGMTKAAIINFTQYLASLYRGSNARFNCVSPGGIEYKQGPVFKGKYSSKVPLGRMAQSQEIADVICYLISEKSSYINGENILADGGFTKW